MPETWHSFDIAENFADNQRGKYGLIDHVFLGLQQAVDKQGFSLDRYAGQLDLLLDSNLEGLEENESNSLEEIDKGNQFDNWQVRKGVRGQCEKAQEEGHKRKK